MTIPSPFHLVRFISLGFIFTSAIACDSATPDASSSNDEASENASENKSADDDEIFPGGDAFDCATDYLNNYKSAAEHEIACYQKLSDGQAADPKNQSSLECAELARKAEQRARRSRNRCAGERSCAVAVSDCLMSCTDDPEACYQECFADTVHDACELIFDPDCQEQCYTNYLECIHVDSVYVSRPQWSKCKVARSECLLECLDKPSP